MLPTVPDHRQETLGAVATGVLGKSCSKTMFGGRGLGVAESSKSQHTHIHTHTYIYILYAKIDK